MRRDSLPRPGALLLVRLLVAFGVGLAIWYAIRLPYARFQLATGAKVLYALGVPTEFRLTEAGQIILYSDGRPPLVIKAYEFALSFVYLAALAVMTPLARLKRAWPLLALSFVALFVAQFIALCVRVAGSFLWFEGSAAAGVVDRITLLGMFAVTHALPFFLYAPVLLKSGLGGPAATASVGRNEPCPCGSGKKYKRCCGSPVEAR